MCVMLSGRDGEKIDEAKRNLFSHISFHLNGSESTGELSHEMNK